MPNIRAESPLQAEPAEVTQTWGERISGGFNLPQNKVWDHVFLIHYGVVQGYSFATSILEVQHLNNFTFIFAIMDHARQTFQTSYWRFSTTNNDTTGRYINCILCYTSCLGYSLKLKDDLNTNISYWKDIQQMRKLVKLR
jgi:hypothetical protein